MTKRKGDERTKQIVAENEQLKAKVEGLEAEKERLQGEIELLRSREQLSIEACAMATEPKLKLREAEASIVALTAENEKLRENFERLSELNNMYQRRLEGTEKALSLICEGIEYSFDFENLQKSKQEATAKIVEWNEERNNLQADNKDLRACNQSMADSTKILWQIIAPDYEGDCNIHQMAQALSNDRDEWKQQHENLLNMYQEQTSRFVALTKDRDEWKREWEMYANAWQRELKGYIPGKTHLIDALVVGTQKLVKEAESLRSQLTTAFLRG